MYSYYVTITKTATILLYREGEVIHADYHERATKRNKRTWE